MRYRLDHFVGGPIRTTTPSRASCSTCQRHTPADLVGDQVTTASEGDLAFAPPGLTHAFAAAPGADADLLIVITPGVEQFEYFRHLARIVKGEATPASLLEIQDRYDTWFGASPAWQQARGTS